VNENRAALPIDGHLPEILAAVRDRGRLVLIAPPGAGKTTRIPPALVPDGPVILLQPRRVAARAIARRIARENGWGLGGQVGWQVRFERNFGRDTALLVATEGILTARLQSDPFLSEFRTVILDEFHERTLHADLALALVKQACRARSDLRLVVMSATLDGSRVAAYLDDCPIIEIETRRHSVAISYDEHLAPADAVRNTLARPGGHILCFLPGSREISLASDQLSRFSPGQSVQVMPLHGRLDADSQDRALAPSTQRKVILATNIAETSLTVEGVTDVIDSGFHKVLRFEHGKAIDRLELERIPADSADQRAGRAGREGPGQALRLWDPRLRLRQHREPEINRIDLTGPFLEVLAWGGDPLQLDWFETPPVERAEAAMELLQRLKLVEAGKLTPLGRMAHQLPLHPRIACVLLAAGATARAARICALLSEGTFRPSQNLATTCDLFWASDDTGRLPEPVKRVADELVRRGRQVLGKGDGEEADERLLRALLAGFPDRVAQRREPGSERLLLARGHGARLARESGVHEGAYLVALDLVSTNRGGTGEALVTQAALVRKDWLVPTSEVLVHEFDEATETVRASLRACYLGLVLGDRPADPNPETAAQILERILQNRDLDAASRRLLCRANLAGIEINVDAVRKLACAGQCRLPQIDLRRGLSASQIQQIDRLCPDHIRVPSGRNVTVDYSGGEATLQVKLQELFGMAESPRLGRDRQPLLIELLAPNQRPVQRTRDLHSFWTNTYPLVRKELRGRYPKHPWPEDPWTAQPTARTKARNRTGS
jgi:ATP-dependent helicase HrpB